MALQEIPPWADQYVGLPYVAGGRSRDGGDCWGLFNLAWSEQFAGSLPAYDGPAWNSTAAFRGVVAAANAYAAQFETVRQGQEELGDGVLMRSCGYPLHLGLVLAPGLMLHILEGGDSTITRYTSMQWRDRIVSFHRFNDGRTLPST